MQSIRLLCASGADPQLDRRALMMEVISIRDSTKSMSCLLLVAQSLHTTGFLGLPFEYSADTLVAVDSSHLDRLLNLRLQFRSSRGGRTKKEEAQLLC